MKKAEEYMAKSTGPGDPLFDAPFCSLAALRIPTARQAGEFTLPSSAPLSPKRFGGQ